MSRIAILNDDYLVNFDDHCLYSNGHKIVELNKEIASDSSLGKGFCIGHSYFCGAGECDAEWMLDVVDFDILPMLSEYWFDEPNKVQRWENTLYGIFRG